MHAVQKLPSIIVTTRDFDQLVAFGLDAYIHSDSHADFLLSELERARLCAPGALPDEVVSVNRQVLYRLDGERDLRRRVLVHRLDLNNVPDELSVASPLGTALLGLRVGDRMPFFVRRLGARHVVHVEGID